MAENKTPETLSDQDKEIQDILSKLESIDSVDNLADIDFLLSNIKVLGNVSNPKFADQISKARKKVEELCKSAAEAALAKDEPLSPNPDHPLAVVYADYAQILEMSDNKENQELGQKLQEKANQELAAYDKEQGLENVDENTPFNQRYEDLNARIKPLEELDEKDEIIAGFTEKLGAENALDMAHLARLEVLSELALSGENLSDEEINNLITERTQQMMLETYTTVSADANIVQGFQKIIDAEIEELKRGEKIPELPADADLLTFTHYAMTHIEDERESSLPDTEKYKKILEEAVKDPKLAEDPEKLAALEYLVSHHAVFGINVSDAAIEEAKKRLNIAKRQGAMHRAYESVLAVHCSNLQMRTTRIAQKTGQPVPFSLQKSIADFKTKHPLIAQYSKVALRVGLTYASSAVLGPAGPFLVSSAYTFKAFKKDREEYAAQHGGSTKGWIKHLFDKENLAKTISTGMSPIISAATLGLGAAEASALASAVTRGTLSLIPSSANIIQQVSNLKNQQKNFEQHLANAKTNNLTPEEKKVLLGMKQKDFAKPDKMTPEQKAVYNKLDPKDREALTKEAQENQSRKRKIGWIIGISVGTIGLGALAISAAKEDGIVHNLMEKLHKNHDEPVPTEEQTVQTGTENSNATDPNGGTTADQQEVATQGNGTSDNSQDIATPGHNPEGLINSIPDEQLKFAANALAVSNKQGLVGMNNILKDIGYEGKIPGTSREMLDLLRSGNLNEQQQNALTDFIKENTYLDSQGHPHLAKGTAWNAFYEKRLTEHLAEQQHTNVGQGTTGQNLGNGTGGTPLTGGAPLTDDAHLTNGTPHLDGTHEQPLPIEGTLDTPAMHDPLVQKAATINEWGTPENPAVAISGKNAVIAYEQTDSNGYTHQHFEEHKGIKFTDGDKDGVADELKTGRALSKTDVVTSPDGQVVSTSEQTFRGGVGGKEVLSNEVTTSYDGDNMVKTETDYSLSGKPQKIVETGYTNGETSSIKQTDCYLNGTPKEVTTTDFIEGSSGKPLSVTKDFYHKGDAEPYATQVRQYDEFTGKQLSLKTTDNATGKVTVQSLASPKEIYNARAQTLQTWQTQASTMDQSSPEYAALSQKIGRLAEQQKISATANPQLAIMVGQGKVNG